ncbi:unnamed protein product [Hymenolepis diminuta]|uniref:MgtE_N domain-containing protein n=1 Tax=Hymenolepis diminuta TaxID=6216 RepID=A0A0R3SVS9_HYMDI|nr:unnamed protein product [Hymenolepis diminuta]
MNFNLGADNMMKMELLYPSNETAHPMDDNQGKSGQNGIPRIPHVSYETAQSSVSVSKFVPSNEAYHFNHFFGYSNQEFIDQNTVDVIFETMPNIPPEIINVLSQLDGDFANYILSSACNPTDMIREMNANTVKHAVYYVPGFSRLLAKSDMETIHSTFYKIPRPCDYLFSLDEDIIHILKSQYTWLDICFTAAFAKTNAKAIFTDSQLLHIKKKIPKFDDLLKRVPADKWNANNKIAVETANMLLVMPDYDARILNEVLNSVSSETPDEELKKMLAKRGSELQGAFLLNLLLDGEIQLFENEETPEEINSPISTTESDEEPEQTVEDTMKFMLSPKWKDASPEEYYKALKNRQNWKEAFASLTYEEMAAVLTRVEEADDFLSQMPEDVIKSTTRKP